MAETGLIEVAQAQDEKIASYLEKKKGSFIYAYFPNSGDADGVVRAHAAGFDNYPFAKVRNPNGLYFIERLLGCSLRTSGEGSSNTFNTSCEPIIRDAGDILKLDMNFGNKEIWQEYKESIEAYKAAVPESEKLPMQSLNMSPFDVACSLCGTENLFIWMYEEPEAADLLLNKAMNAYLWLFYSIKRLGMKQVNLYGFPCLYANDLLLVNLSPEMIARFMLPLYERAARSWRGLMLAINSPDTGLIKRITGEDWIVGCCIDKRVALSEVREMIGDRLLIVNHCLRDPRYDKPTLVDGMWVNPIIQSHGDDLEGVWRALKDKNLLVTIERRTLEEVVDTLHSLKS